MKREANPNEGWWHLPVLLSIAILFILWLSIISFPKQGSEQNNSNCCCQCPYCQTQEEAEEDKLADFIDRTQPPISC